jgi:hypothetical protein
MRSLTFLFRFGFLIIVSAECDELDPVDDDDDDDDEELVNEDLHVVLFVVAALDDAALSVPFFPIRGVVVVVVLFMTTCVFM